MGVIRKRLLFLPLLLSLLLVPTSASADFATGLAAYERGDYKTAFEEFKRLAQQGYAGAQTNLGLMYAKGQGVPEDYVQAHMWINIVASRSTAEKHKEYSKVRDLLAKVMTPSQIAEAQELAREWKPKKE